MKIFRRRVSRIGLQEPPARFSGKGNGHAKEILLIHLGLAFMSPGFGVTARDERPSRAPGRRWVRDWNSTLILRVFIFDLSKSGQRKEKRMLTVLKTLFYPQPSTPGEKRMRDEMAVYCHREMMQRLRWLKSVLEEQASWQGAKPDHLLRTVQLFLWNAGETPLFQEAEMPRTGSKPMPESSRELSPEEEERQRPTLVKEMA
ncbi:MAG: hypothetical protein LBE85_05200 [Candidatus Accumulibacter sp.]|nr:hypothetical protein [Accumulibacter sp.]